MASDERHNICVIDDDLDYAQFVQRYLTAVGHNVRAYTTPQAFMADLGALDSDIYLIDLMLPGMDGIDLVSMVRAHCEAGIIVVSGRMGPDAFTTALAAGADMFINKPVRADQIAQAITALRRRLRLTEKAPVAPSWSLDLGRGLLRAPDGEEIKLGAMEQRIVTALAEAGGEGHSRGELAGLAQVAPSPDDRNLDAAVFRLRRKIEERTGKLSPIVTRHGKGYALSSPIRVKSNGS